MNNVDYKVGEVIELVYRRKHAVEVRSTVVSHFNKGADGKVEVCFKGVESGQGAFTPDTVGTKPYGIVAVHRTGKTVAAVSFMRSPRPGDRAYDNMC